MLESYRYTGNFSMVSSTITNFLTRAMVVAKGKEALITVRRSAWSLAALLCSLKH